MKIDAERTELKNAALDNESELNRLRQEKIAELTAFQHELLRLAPEDLYGSTTLTTSGQPAPAVAHGAMGGMHPEFSPQGKVSSEQAKKDLVKQLAAQLKKRVIHE